VLQGLLPLNARERLACTWFVPVARANISARIQNKKQRSMVFYFHLLSIYFQLQFGCELRPPKVNCCSLVPSASMDQICSEPDRLD